MPQVTVYIRNEDLEAWQGVIRKSEFIHNALQDRSTYDGAKIVMREAVPEVTVHTMKVDHRPILDQQNDPKSDLYSSDIKPDIFLDASKGTSVAVPKLKKAIETKAVLVPTCKIHGTPLDERGKCLQKGCKYA